MVLGLATGFAVVPFSQTRAIEPDAPANRPETQQSEKVQPQEPPFRNPDWNGPRPPQAPPGPHHHQDGPPHRLFRPEPGGPPPGHPGRLREHRRPQPQERERAERERDLERMEQIRRLRDELQHRDAMERERMERELMEREKMRDRERLERARMEERERMEARERMELDRRHRAPQPAMHDLERRRQELDTQLAEIELERRHAEIQQPATEAALDAVQMAAKYLEPAAATDFLNDVLPDTESPAVRRAIRRTLAELNLKLRRPDEATEHLRHLITH